MTQEHPTTPNPFQLDQWEAEARATTDPSLLDEPGIRAGRFGVIHRKALRLAFATGADEELMACINWLYENGWGQVVDGLRDARRPKPSSLKEEALLALSHLEKGAEPQMDATEAAYTIRRALKSLPD